MLPMFIGPNGIFSQKSGLKSLVQRRMVTSKEKVGYLYWIQYTSTC